MAKPVVELPEICLVIAEDIGAQLEADGIPAERAAVLALSAAKSIMKAYGGESVYIPKGTFVEYTKRDREIVALLPHLNTREICARYNITPRRLYQIIHAVYDGVEKPTQLDLFDAGE